MFDLWLTKLTPIWVYFFFNACHTFFDEFIFWHHIAQQRNQRLGDCQINVSDWRKYRQ